MPTNGLKLPFIPKSRCSWCGFSAQPVGAACLWCHTKLSKLRFHDYMRLKKAGHKIDIPEELLKQFWENRIEENKRDPAFPHPKEYFTKYNLPMPQGHTV